MKEKKENKRLEPSYDHETLISLLLTSIESQLEKFRASNLAELASFTKP